MDALDRAVEYCGGVTKLAEAIGVGQSVVSNWRKRRSTIDAAGCVAIETATCGAVRRWDLRPHDWHKNWPELVGTPGAPAKPAAPAAARDVASVPG